MEGSLCKICQSPLGSVGIVTLGVKGSAGLSKASKERQDNLTFVTGQVVHSACRQEYCKPQIIAKYLQENSSGVPPLSQQFLI